MCDHWRINVTTAIPVTVCCLLTVAVGYPIFGEFIPNGHRVPDPCRRDKVWESVGHQGFLKRSPLNAFGVDFANSMSWDKHLCELDSDGDGRTNGEELGDPNCTWASPDSTSNTVTTDSLSHPGICEPLNSSRCLSRNLWLNGCRPFTCPGLNATDVRSIRLSLAEEVAIPPARMDTTGVLAPLWRTPGRRTICMKVALPSEEKDYHVIGSQPVLNPSLLHHVEDITLYACEEDLARVLTNSQFDCDAYPRDLGIKFGCYNIIAAWSWSGPAGECHPTLYGFRIGRRTYRSAILRVQMHSNRASETKVRDAGLVIFYTEQLRPNDAGTLVIEASPLSLLGPRTSRQGKCLRPKENRDCTGGYTTTINIAQTVIVTDNFDGARITVEVQNKSGSIQKLLEWTNFSDPNSYSSILLPEFEPEDELVLNCVTHSSALFCLSRITYYPAISRLGHCDGTPPIDVIPSATCPLPGVDPMCRIGYLLHQSTDTFTECPWKPEACLNLCELILDTILKSGCGSSDLKVQSKSFSQLIRYVDFIQTCPSGTGIPRTFPVHRSFPIQRTTTTLSSILRIPDDVSSVSVKFHERDLYHKRSWGGGNLDPVINNQSGCNQIATDAYPHLKKLMEDRLLVTPVNNAANLAPTCKDEGRLNYVCGCPEYSVVCKYWSKSCLSFNNLFSNQSSSNSTASSETFATKSVFESSLSSTAVGEITLDANRSTVERRQTKKSMSTDQSVDQTSRSNNSSTSHFTRDPVEFSSSTKSVDRTRISTGDSGPSTKVPTTPWSSIRLDEVSAVGIVHENVFTRLSVNRTRVSTGDSGPSTKVPTTPWSSIRLDEVSAVGIVHENVFTRLSVNRTRISTGDSKPSTKVPTTPWSSVGQDEVPALGNVHVNVGRSLSAAAKTTGNIFAAWMLLGLLCARFVVDGFHVWNRF